MNITQHQKELPVKVALHVTVGSESSRTIKETGGGSLCAGRQIGLTLLYGLNIRIIWLELVIHWKWGDDCHHCIITSLRDIISTQICKSNGL